MVRCKFSSKRNFQFVSCVLSRCFQLWYLALMAQKLTVSKLTSAPAEQAETVSNNRKYRYGPCQGMKYVDVLTLSNELFYMNINCAVVVNKIEIDIHSV